MNKELELEADLWSTEPKNVHPVLSYIAKQGFLSGATSKYVKKQKLEFAIEQLKPYLEWNNEISISIERDIKKLEQKLSEI